MPIESLQDMKVKRNELARLLKSVAENIDALDDVGLNIKEGEMLWKLKSKLEKDNFKVLILGEFKNGKSTFINALMGEKLLPAYSTPCTAVINEIVFGEDKKATLYFKNPLPEKIDRDIAKKSRQHIQRYESMSEIPPIEINISDLEDYVTISDPTREQTDAVRESPYSKAVLEMPIKLCEDGVEFIDSPGLNENGIRTKVTNEYLMNADAIIFVMRCPKLCAQSEMDYIENNIRSKRFEDIFFVCNAINQVPDDEQDRLIKFATRRLSECTSFGENGIFFLNALGALEAKRNKDRAALAKTGLPEFENALMKYLRNNKGQLKLLQVINPFIDLIDTVNDVQITNYKYALRNDVKKLEDNIQKALPQLRSAEMKLCEIRVKIDEYCNEFKDEVNTMMLNKYDEIYAKLPNFINNLDLENKMGSNPFHQKEKKSALENEIIAKTQLFIETEIGNWQKESLNGYIDSFISEKERLLGDEIGSFYDKIDGFRYQLSGVERPKDISATNRVMSTIFGTLVGGPAYGAIGASMGFGEMMKKNLILSGGILAVSMLVPMGTAALAATALITKTVIGTVQFLTAGNTLEKKYKKNLTTAFQEELVKNRESESEKMAEDLKCKMHEHMMVIDEALQKEVENEKANIEELRRNAQKGAEERDKKVKKLEAISNELINIRARCEGLKQEIN